jgi:hypothetical protein
MGQATLVAAGILNTLQKAMKTQTLVMTYQHLHPHVRRVSILIMHYYGAL